MLLKKVCIIENKNSFLVLPFKNTCTFIHKKTRCTLSTEIMNYLKFTLPILLMCSISTLPLLLFGQENCKVLNPAISGNYEGKCKNGLASGKGVAIGLDRYEGQFSKGLADGDGTYTWSTGEIYVGEWKAGLRNGTGAYTMYVNGKDSIQSGVWENDKYLGTKPKAPKIRLNGQKWC